MAATGEETNARRPAGPLKAAARAVARGDAELRALSGSTPRWRAIPAQLAAVEIGANLAAGVITFVFLEVLYPTGGENGSAHRSAMTVAFITFLAAAIPLGCAINALQFRPVIRWRTDQRPATPEEQRATLAQPIRQAAGAFALWMVAAATFGGLMSAKGYPGQRIAASVVGIVLGGLTSCTLTAFAVERVLRPLSTAALAGRRASGTGGVGIRPRLIVAWAFGSGLPVVGVAVVVLNPHVDRASSFTVPVVALCAATLVSGFAMTYAAARSVAEPLKRVRRAMSQVSAGNLGTEVTVDDAGEVGQLEVGFNEMVRGLRERRDLAELLGRYVGAAVAEQALERGDSLGGERTQASMLFVDLVGSTEMVAALRPEEVVRRLNRYFETVVEVVGADGGWVNKFEGDGALCVFGPPGDMASHPSHALRAARMLRQALAALDGGEGAGLDAAIGVSSGEVVAGNIGSHDRFEYTVIGDPVNEAARLTELAKGRPGRVLASAAVLEEADADEAVHWAVVGRSTLRGRPRPTTLYEPC